MALVSSKKMLQDAKDGKYAVGAFNVNNMEIIQGIMEAAQQENAPVILQVSAGARNYAKSVYLTSLVDAAIKDTGVDAVLHLDHGDSYELCKACIDDGFTSVMIDASKYEFDKNVEITKKVVDYAHDHGVTVEAELGKLAGVEDAVKVAAKDATYTDPEEAAEFVEKTGVDSLAIAIGTSHGAYKFKGTPSLDYDRLVKVCELIPNFPIVLHGASSVPKEFLDLNNKYGADIPGAQGVPEDMLAKAAGLGVAKINVDTDIRLAMTAAIRKVFVEQPDVFDPRGYLKPARTAVKDMVAHKMRVFGCAGHGAAK